MTHDFEKIRCTLVCGEEGEDRPTEVVVEEVVLVLDGVELRVFGRRQIDSGSCSSFREERAAKKRN
jgi:hypothetical protein